MEIFDKLKDIKNAGDVIDAAKEISKDIKKEDIEKAADAVKSSGIELPKGVKDKLKGVGIDSVDDVTKFLGDK